MNILKMMKIADIFTVANFASGVAAIFAAVSQNFLWSAVFMLLAVAFDFLDGRIARYTKTTNDFGKQLDSLSDLTSFGVAPAVFGYCLGLDGILGMIVLISFACCGMLRLARFNVLNIKGFIGIPITTNGLTIPIVYFAFRLLGYTTLDNLTTYIALAIYAVSGFLMVSSIRVGKI